MPRTMPSPELTAEALRFILEVADDYNSKGAWGHIDKDGVAHF